MMMPVYKHSISQKLRAPRVTFAICKLASGFALSCLAAIAIVCTMWLTYVGIQEYTKQREYYTSVLDNQMSTSLSCQDCDIVQGKYICGGCNAMGTLEEYNQQVLSWTNANTGIAIHNAAGYLWYNVAWPSQVLSEWVYMIMMTAHDWAFYSMTFWSLWFLWVVMRYGVYAQFKNMRRAMKEIESMPPVDFNVPSTEDITSQVFARAMLQAAQHSKIEVLPDDKPVELLRQRRTIRV